MCVVLSHYNFWSLKIFKSIVVKQNYYCRYCFFFLTILVISIDVLNDYIIPGLRAVKQDIEALAPDCEVRLLCFPIKINFHL